MKEDVSFKPIDQPLLWQWFISPLGQNAPLTRKCRAAQVSHLTIADKQ
jgi:hypothetical protein